MNTPFSSEYQELYTVTRFGYICDSEASCDELNSYYLTSKANSSSKRRHVSLRSLNRRQLILMPRLSHSLLLRAKSPFLRLVLRGTRTLDSAVNELRWLKEHVQESLKSPTYPRQSRQRLLKLCQRRARGEPLQYILGSQPFGDLDVKCRPGVLIPR
jgi:hypothetical protein